MGLRLPRVSNSSLDAGATGGASKSNTFRTAAPVAQIRNTGDLGDAGGYVGRKESDFTLSNSHHSGDKAICN